jgi:hypothetical protein
LEQLNGDLLVDPAHGETQPPLGCDLEVVKTCADAICAGPRSKERKKRREEKRNKTRLKCDAILHISTS